MDLSSLLPALRQSVEPEKAIASGLLPLPTSARAPVAASMLSERKLLIVSPRFDRVLTLAQELPYWTPHTPVAIFPEPDPLFYEKLPWGVPSRLQRAESWQAWPVRHPLIGPSSWPRFEPLCR